MNKWVRRGIFLILLLIFLGSAGMVFSILRQYRTSERLYDDAVTQFISVVTVQNGAEEGLDGPAQTTVTTSGGPGPVAANQSADQSGGDAVAGVPGGADPGEAERDSFASDEIAPLIVDFEALRAVAPDAQAWLYCPGTVINYPVVQGEDDDYYLHRSYDGAYNYPGSIFAEALNQPDFQDYNTILYGHNMRDGSMFACLSSWADQVFYEEHPVMWLLTPRQDYKVELFSGYTISAYSDTYQIITQPGEELNGYLDMAVANSDFDSRVELNQEAHYVLLSTCAYVFNNARYVLHGMLRPVNSAGGRPLS